MLCGIDTINMISSGQGKTLFWTHPVRGFESLSLKFLWATFIRKHIHVWWSHC